MFSKIKYETYLDTISRREKSWPITRIAQDYGLSAQALNKILLANNIIIKTTNENRPYLLTNNTYGSLKDFSKLEQQYIGINKHAVNNGHRDTVVYNKTGMLAIYKILKKLGIRPINELLLDQTIDMSNDNIKPEDLCIVRRPGLLTDTSQDSQRLYISYYKNIGKDDKFGIDYQYLNSSRLNEFTELMKGSILSTEEPRGPRLDIRNKEAYTKIMTSMNNYYDLYFGYTKDQLDSTINNCITRNKAMYNKYFMESV